MVCANPNTFCAFFRDERGVVTTDLVVLAAGVVAFGMATVMVISGGVENVSGETAQDLADTPVGVEFD